MYQEFHFKYVDFSPSDGEVKFGYQIDNTIEMVETFVLPGAPFALNTKQQQALDKVLHYWHLAAGVSYYKAFLPQKIVLDNFELTASEAEFFQNFYINGLGEFAVRNRLHFFDKIVFPYNPNLSRTPVDLELRDEVLLPIGGGKDSCLSIALLQNLRVKTTAIACGSAKPIDDVIAQAGLPKIIVRRQISPKLLELNQTGKVYNGHVPITGILAFMLWAVSIIYDKRYVVMSCERSASSGNLTYDGININHQYSKSYDFERNFHNITTTITPDFCYFSLLRPLSELHIAKLFAAKCEKYFSLVTSCNKAFKLDINKRLQSWCGNCDKCRFVFLILAPFIAKDRLIAMVGHNPLNDPAQIKGYEDLLGLGEHKPFECVGEFAESIWALAYLQNRPEWQDDCVIKALSDRVKADDADLFATSSQHMIPERFKNVMAEFK